MDEKIIRFISISTISNHSVHTDDEEINCSDISEKCKHIGAPLHLYGLILLPAWICNHMPGKVWHEIIYPFPNFNGATFDVWESISNFIPHFIIDVITYPGS